VEAKKQGLYWNSTKQDGIGKRKFRPGERSEGINSEKWRSSGMELKDLEGGEGGGGGIGG